MRLLAIAIEAYYVDNNMYPAWGAANRGPGGTMTHNYRLATSKGQSGGLAELPSFLMNNTQPGGQFKTLRNPVNYISDYPADVFAPVDGATFVYWSVFPGQPSPATATGRPETPIGVGAIVAGRPNPSFATGRRETPFGGVGWILVSPGPDGDYDIAGDWSVYNPAIRQPSPRLLTGTNKKGAAFTYDPTNGIASNGDIWRVKQ